MGHTHFDVDQRHSILSRFLLGVLSSRLRGRRELHSLSAFAEAVKKAHSDLLFLNECTRNYDFDIWLASMKNKLEVGLQQHHAIQLRRGDPGVILCRSKPRMSPHVAWSSWETLWPPDESMWYKNIKPVLPSFNSSPLACPPQKWKNFDKVKKTLTQFYNDKWSGVNAQDKWEMLNLLRSWGNDPSPMCAPPPTWSNFETVMPRTDTPLPKPVDVPRRVPPLILASYQPLGLPKKT